MLNADRSGNAAKRRSRKAVCKPDSSCRRRRYVEGQDCRKTVSAEELLFFDKKPAALPIYEVFRKRVLTGIPEARIEVKKTQISFFSGHLFAAVSFAPVRKAKERPDPFLTVTFGLPCRIESARIDAAAEPYPGRWTHHVMIGTGEEADGELIGWIREAADFAGRK